MQITVKPLKGDNFKVDSAPESKVEDLKKKIAEAKPEYPAEQQKLIYSGKILKDDQTVQEIGIKPEEFIVVMVAKAKPPTGAAPSEAAAAPAAPAPAAEPAPAAGGAAAPLNADTAAATLVTGSGMESTITQLCDMGFARPEVERCLAAAFNNPDRAVEYLMSGIPEGILPPAGGEPAAPPAAGAPPAQTPPAAAGGAGGGGLAFPAMGAPAAGGAPGGGGAAMPPALQELRNHPQFAQLAAMVAQNPQVLAQMLPALQQSNPELMQAIQENPQAFMQLLQEVGAGGGAPQDPVAAMMAAAGGGGGGEGGEGGAPPGSIAIRLNEDERAAVERLVALGFDSNMAIQAYLACDKNEELAANFLFESGMDTSD